MKKLILALAIIAASPAHAATAFFTGRQEMVTTVTYQQAWNCEYSYLGRNFWRIHRNYCPSSVEVQ